MLAESKWQIQRVTENISITLWHQLLPKYSGIERYLLPIPTVSVSCYFKMAVIISI